MNTLQASWRIACKDLRAYFRDKTGLALGFALPIVLVLAFGFVFEIAFGGFGGGGLSRVTLWVADEDGSDASRAFVASLREAEMLNVRPEPDDAPETSAGVRRMVEDGEAHHALVVEPGFAGALADGRFPTLRLIRDPDREMEAQMVSFGLLQAFFSSQGPELAPAFTARALELTGMPPQFHDRVMALSRGFSSSIGTLFGEAEALPHESAAAAAGDDGPDFSNVMSDLIPVEREDVKPPDRPKELTYQLAQSVSGIAVMMLMFGLVACGTMLIQEREEGTLQRLLLTPAPRHALLFGKFLFAIVVGAIQLVVMFIIGGLVFRVNFLANPVALLVISAVVLVSITSFGMLVAGFARTTKQAEGLSTLVILVMSALGGAWFPIQMIPLPLVGEIVTRCTLTWWAMDAYQSMLWHGKSWTAPNVLIDLGVLLLFALAATLLAVRLFRSRYLS